MSVESISVHCGSYSQAQPLLLDGTDLPRLSVDNDYTYLGINEGYNHVHERFRMNDKLQQVGKQTVALLHSRLAS